MKYKVVTYIRVEDEDNVVYDGLLAAAKKKNEMEFKMLSSGRNDRVFVIYEMEDDDE